MRHLCANKKLDTLVVYNVTKQIKHALNIRQMPKTSNLKQGSKISIFYKINTLTKNTPAFNTIRLLLLLALFVLSLLLFLCDITKLKDVYRG